MPAYKKIGEIRMKTEETTWRAVTVLIKCLAAVVIIFMLAIAGKTAYQFGYCVFAQQPLSDPPGKEAAITVWEGETIKEIAETLEANGIVQDALVFCVQERLSKYQGKLQPGTYVMNSAQTPEAILQTLTGVSDETDE